MKKAWWFFYDLIMPPMGILFCLFFTVVFIILFDMLWAALYGTMTILWCWIGMKGIVLHNKRKENEHIRDRGPSLRP